MISEQLKSDLLKLNPETFKKLEDAKQKKKPITAGLFEDLATKINKKIKPIIASSKTLEGHLWKVPPKTLPEKLINAVTLWRYFGYDSAYKRENSSHGTSNRYVQFILLYLDIDSGEWPKYLVDVKPKTENFNKLINCWYIYRVDHKSGTDEKTDLPEIKRSVLKLTEEKKGRMDAQFVSLNTTFHTGVARRIGNILSITFENADKAIEVFTKIGNGDVLNAATPHLNAIIRSVGDGPYCKRAIMVCANNPNLEVNDGEIQTVYHSSQKHNVDAIGGESTDPIVEYLLRKTKVLRSREFENGNLDQIRSRNKVYYGDSKKFEDLKKFVANICTSIASVDCRRSQISMNTYEFKFIDLLKRCEFTCTRVDADEQVIEIKGQAIYVNNRVILNSINEVSDIFSCIMKGKKERLFATATFINASGHFKINEIIRPKTELSILKQDISKDGDNSTVNSKIDKATKISYNQLVEHVKLLNENDSDKLFLFEKNVNLNDWPPSNEFARNYNKLQLYAGRWLVYLPSSDRDALFVYAIKIDNLGFCTEKTIDLDEGTEVQSIYEGNATIMENTLRLSNFNTTGQNSEYVLRMKSGIGAVHCIQGIRSNVDLKFYPCSDACIAVKYTGDDEYFAPQILRKKDAKYNELATFVESKIHMTMHDFFYVNYPSMHRKKRFISADDQKK